MRLQVYELSRCGIYELRQNKAPLFGAFTEWWSDFEAWVNDGTRPFAGTATFEAEEVPRRVYCAATASDGNGAYGVTLWNESEINDEGLPSISADDPLKSLDIDLHKVGRNQIPGWPTYLWFVPDKSAVAVLMPNNRRGSRTNGLRHARDYFREYLRCFSKYADPQLVTPVGPEEHYKIDAYTDPTTGTSRKPQEILIRFETRQHIQDAQLDKLVRDYEQIYKIIRAGKMTIDGGDQRTGLGKAMDILSPGPPSEANNSKTKHFRWETEWSPQAPDDVQHEIDSWREWNESYCMDNYRVGVRKARDSSNVHYFDQVLSKQKIETGSSAIESETVWTEGSLREAWKLVQGHVFRMIDGPGR